MKFIGKTRRGKNSIFYTLRSDVSITSFYGKAIKHCGYKEGSWAWGYNGKSPLETAETLLQLLWSRAILNGSYYKYIKPFHSEIIAKLPDNWELTDKEILQWIEKQNTQPKA